MKTDRTLAIVLALALTLGSGCAALQGPGTPTGTDSATLDGAAIANETAAGIESVDSYTYNSTVTASRNGTTSRVTINGTVDRADRRLRIHQVSGNQTGVQYVVDDTIYVRSGGDWTSTPLGNGSFWSDSLPLAEQRTILQQANATFERNGTVDGTEVAVLSVNLSERQLRQYLTRRLGFRFSPETNFTDVSYEVSVTRDDHRLVRVTSETTASFRNQTLDVTTAMDVGGYGENVTVELPDEIADAG